MAMCRPEWLPQSSVGPPGDASGKSDDAIGAESAPAPRCLALDGNALGSLEVGDKSCFCSSQIAEERLLCQCRRCNPGMT